MAITTNDRFTKIDLANQFNTRVRDWVVANTDWVASTWLFEVGLVNVQGVVANSTAYGGSVNRNAIDSTAQVGSGTTDYDDKAIAGSTTVNGIVNTMKNFLQLYAKTHNFYVINTGNVDPGANSGIAYNASAPLDGNQQAVFDGITADVASAATSNNIVSGARVTATNIANFVESCRNIWYNRCRASVSESFYYNYCHSSCHSNLTCYNSRGRR